MFKSSCELAKFLENVAAESLEQERASNHWKVKETSLTDLIIASFRVLSRYSSIEVDASNELETNADFEVIFRFNDKDLTVLFQAKRTQKRNSGSFSIPELFHPDRSGQQNKLLIDHCRTYKKLAYYAIFLPSSARSTMLSSYKTVDTGIVCEKAETIRRMAYGGAGRNKLSLAKTLKIPIPFHIWFCQFENSLSMEEFTQQLGIPEPHISPSLETHQFVTQSRSLQERSAEREYMAVSTRILLQK